MEGSSFFHKFNIKCDRARADRTGGTGGEGPGVGDECSGGFGTGATFMALANLRSGPQTLGRTLGQCASTWTFGQVTRSLAHSLTQSINQSRAECTGAGISPDRGVALFVVS